MSRHFYAVYWPYGVNISNFDHEPIGTVVPFDTAKARDAYVAADRFDGNFHRSVPDYRLIRKMMLGALREFRSLDSKGYEGWRVAIPSEASEALARLVGERRRGAVFREDSGVRLRQQTAVGIVSSVALRVGVPGISPHSLRRTFCTLSRDAGVPDRDIMAAAGWSSPQMLDYYDMARRGLNGKAGDGLQDYLGKED